MDQEVFEYARQGKLEELQEALTKAGPDDYIDYEGQTALVMALRNGRLMAATILLEHGADVNLCTSDESTMLHCAIHSQDIDCVKLVLSRGVNVNARTDEGQTALHMAAYLDHVDICKLLVEAGADVNIDSDFGRPLDDAKPQCAEFLKSKGARIGEGKEVKASAAQHWGYDCFDGEQEY